MSWVADDVTETTPETLARHQGMGRYHGHRSRERGMALDDWQGCCPPPSARTASRRSRRQQDNLLIRVMVQQADHVSPDSSAADSRPGIPPRRTPPSQL